MSQRIGPLRGYVRARTLILPCLILLQGLAGAARAQDWSGLRDVGLRRDWRGSTGVLLVEPSLRLDGVMPEELLAGGRARAMAATSWRPDAPPAGAFELDTRVARSVPAVWRMRFDDPAEVAELSVRCEIVAPGGEADTLSHAEDPRSVIHVWVRPLAPQIVPGAADGGTLIEGGVVLDMDLRNVRTAGAHTGTLTVTVEHI